MDIWKYFDIGHRHHVLCNPTSIEKLDELIDLLEVPEHGRILDVACGKGAFLLRALQRWMCHGVGVDLSPPFVEELTRNVELAGMEHAVDIHEMDGAEYAGEPDSFDAAVCLGASWIWGGYPGTLEALAGFAKPGGFVVSGEPFFRGAPPAEYLAATGYQADSFGTHRGNVETGAEKGLVPLYTIVSSEDDWDRYEGLQWYAAERWALDEPDDPDVDELLDGIRKERDRYLRWGREQLGWAIYLFQKP